MGDDGQEPIIEILLPDKRLTQGRNTWSFYSSKKTALSVVTLHDAKTGITLATPLANPEKRTASYIAWAGARHSRAPGDTIKIMSEMEEKDVDPDVKLEGTVSVKGYGHASVGDMARINVHFNNCPMTMPFALFNVGDINDGQEKSTRFQEKFGKEANAVLHPLVHYLPASGALENLEGEFQGLGNASLELFAKHKPKLKKAFTEFFKPEDKKQEGSLDSRVLDCVRFFLLLGQNTGFSYGTSARDWSRKIADLKASPVPAYQDLAQQLETMLAPSLEIEKRLGFKAEAPSLIRHTEPNPTLRQNLEALRIYLKQTDLLEKIRLSTEYRGVQPLTTFMIPADYSAVERMVAQYVLAVMPGLEYEHVLGWVRNNDVKTRKEISGIIYNGHTHHKELPSSLSRTTDLSFVIEAAMGEQRDFNRHRSCGRFIQHFPLPHGLPVSADMFDQIFAAGFQVPLYLTEVPEFANEAREFMGDLNQYEDKLGKFVGSVRKEYGKDIDHTFAISGLPLGHRANLFMHFDPKQGHYITGLRVRNGGHINYRVPTFEMNQQFADSDPYFEGMRLAKKPDPAGREEFFDRS